MTASRAVAVGKLRLGGGGPLFVIAGPCVIESEDAAVRHAVRLAAIAVEVSLPLVYKSSFDKANRTARDSFRGPGLDEGLRILERCRRESGLAVLTDIHLPSQAAPAAEVCDILQIPAFLCRQTDLLAVAAKTGKAVNVKKGQWMAPEDMAHAVEKITGEGNRNVILTERGSSFGYRTLVTDFRSIPKMRALGFPVVLDGTHSVQEPGGRGKTSGGRREFAPLMLRAGVVAGCDGVFLETHEDPDRALSDGPNQIPLGEVPRLLRVLRRLREVMREEGAEGT